MKSLLLLIFAVVGVFGQVPNLAVEVFAPYVRVSGDAPTGTDVNAFRLSGESGMSTFLALCDATTCNGFTCTADSTAVCTANTNITSFVDGTLIRFVTSATVGGRTFAVGAMSASTALVASIAATGEDITAGDATAALTTFMDATVSVTALTSTPGFTVELSQEASVSMLAFAASGVAAGQYILMGWGTRFPLVPEVVVACIPGTALTCSEFTCDTARMCSTPGSALGSITGTATASAVTYSYPTASLTGFDATMSQKLWLQSATGTAVAAAQVQLFQNNVFQSTPVTPFTGTAPSFGFTAAMESATSTRFTVTPASGNYAAVGFGTGANTFPSSVAVCDPENVETCSLFTCTGASTCAAMTNTTGYTQTRNVGTSNLVVTNTALGMNPILYWLTAASTTINAALIQGQTWTQYTYPVSQLTTAPTFPVAFSRPSDTTLSVTLEPGSTSTVYFGWRMNAAMAYPVDAVVCSPSTVTTCLDVSCTSATTCVARTSTTTIYTSNSASGSSATLTRALASGNAPLSATMDMYLAWDLKSSTTATLDASEVQTGRTWRFYSAQVPSVGSTSSAFSVLPSVLTMLALVVYML